MQNRKPSEIQPPSLQLNFVRVGGQYRVGKLLGSGGSGEPKSYSTLIHFTELSRERISRERYQDGSRSRSEDRALEPLAVETQS
jgi:hypothetical protein